MLVRHRIPRTLLCNESRGLNVALTNDFRANVNSSNDVPTGSSSFGGIACETFSQLRPTHFPPFSVSPIENAKIEKDNWLKILRFVMSETFTWLGSINSE